MKTALSMPGPRCFAVAAALGTSALALAETSPYYIGASQSFTYESNVFKVSNPGALVGVDGSDTVSTTSLFAGFDQPISRQRVFGSASVGTNRYFNNDLLNNVSYGLLLGLDWETVNEISGGVRIGATQQLGDFNSQTGQGLREKNTENGTDLRADIRVGLVNRLSATGAISRRDVSFSAEEFASSERTEDAYSLGLSYRLGGATTVGAAYRHTTTEYPRAFGGPTGPFTSDSATGRNIDLTASWYPLGVSSFTGRVSFGRTEYDVDTARDFSGVTGSLVWNWQPTGKLRLTTSIARDTDDNLYRVPGEVGQPALNTDRTEVTSALRVGATYSLSGKVSLGAAMRQSWRSLVSESSIGDVQNTQRDRDRTSTYDLSVNWAATRTADFSCLVSFESRNGSAQSSSYDANTFGCRASITLRP